MTKLGKILSFAICLNFGCSEQSMHYQVKNVPSELNIALQNLDHVKSIQEVETKFPLYRQFEIQFEQPIDHTQPTSGKFLQRIVLLHRDESAPMVLQTSGYAIFGIKLSSVTKLFGTNQLQVEHRYFAASTPPGDDKTFLNIEQSAADFHAITQSFKKLYAKKWVNTGASKGGMTSVFHRRFYPEDLDGTLALVAPLSFSEFDERYIDFVSNVGGEEYAVCRQKLLNAQKFLLNHRSNVLPTLTGTYAVLKSKEIAFEHAVIELAYTFWQYSTPSDVTCSNVPSDENSVLPYIHFLAKTNAVESSYEDKGLGKFMSYYYQAATQLGGPGADIVSIEKELHFANTYKLESYVPPSQWIGFDSAPMIDMDQWVRKAPGLMFIYGAFDPWSAGAFSADVSGGESFKFFQPKGNHGSDLSGLGPSDYKKAVERLSVWLGVKAAEVNPMDNLNADISLEQLEFQVLKTRRWKFDSSEIKGMIKE